MLVLQTYSSHRFLPLGTQIESELCELPRDRHMQSDLKAMSLYCKIIAGFCSLYYQKLKACTWKWDSKGGRPKRKEYID